MWRGERGAGEGGERGVWSVWVYGCVRVLQDCDWMREGGVDVHAKLNDPR